MNWIAVALSMDVPRKLVMPARVYDVDLAIWRDSSGTCHAWGDRCPHRGMRLSHGFVRGDMLACIYHGWQYDDAGKCAHIPAHPKMTPPQSICAQTYPCVERGGVIWAATDHPGEEQPPDTGAFQPLRSVPVACAANDVSAQLSKSETSLWTNGALVIAIQPQTETSCMMHVLTQNGEDRSVMSAETEKLRDALERRAA